MGKLASTLLVTIGLLQITSSPLQASKKKLVSNICALIAKEDIQTATQFLILLRQYCMIQKELNGSLYIPEPKQQNLTQQSQQKRAEIKSFLDGQKSNTCLINKTIQGLRAFELYKLNLQLKIIEAILDTLERQKS
jgi:hypothetical protein